MGSFKEVCMKWRNPRLGPNVSTFYNSYYSNGGAGNVYLLVLSSWKVNIAKNPIADRYIRAVCAS